MQALKKHLSVKIETDCGVRQHISLLGKHSWYSILALSQIFFFPRIFWLNMVMMDNSSHTTFLLTHTSLARGEVDVICFYLKVFAQ